MVTLLPCRAWYAAHSPVEIEVRGLEETRPAGLVLRSHRLGRLSGSVGVEGEGVVTLSPAGADGLGLGGHAVELCAADGQVLARTAVEVRDAGPSATRYGFVAAYERGRDLSGVLDWARAQHLTTIQFYDWAFRHADLMGAGESYADPLGNPVDLATVRALIEALHEIRVDAIGYAAVYGIGVEDWPAWEHRALLDAEGTAYGLGDFLQVIDPAAPDWLVHLGSMLRAARESVGFDGFHLDQYGWPKLAATPDGRRVDVAESFVTMLNGVRDAVPDATLIFNNVNDFPTRVTATQAPVDTTYIEVWSPHDRLGDLARLATSARDLAPDRPVVLAAYPSAVAGADEAEAAEGVRLELAAAYSHGATVLLAGEDGRVLVDPYYPRNQPAGPALREVLTRYADFQLAHADLLTGADVADVTGAYAGAYNDDVEVRGSQTPIGGQADEGTIWRRVVETPAGLVVHLINLLAVTDPLWDSAHPAPADPGPLTLRVRRVGPEPVRVWSADPDAAGRLERLEGVVSVGSHAEIALPPLRTWQLVWIESR